MTTITCRIPPELYAALETLARRQRVPKSVIVRRAIEQLARSTRRSSRPTAYDLAKNVCGSLHGPRDLATNPKYMEGFGD